MAALQGMRDQRNRMKMVQRPSHDANPKTSVKVVMNTDEASAGSTFMARSASGISVPAVAATNMLMSIAAPRMAPSQTFPFHIQTTMAPTRPQAMPLPMPTPASLSSALRVLAQVNSPSAMPRTITVSVWVAALPPMPATTGMKMASAGTSLMRPSKSATTDAAMNAVRRFTSSHGTRLRSDSPTVENTRSSPATPARR